MGSHPSTPYVRMGMIIESANCHIAPIFMPFNSLFPVSVVMFCVAAWIFLSSFRFSLLLSPLPIFTIFHLAAPNSIVWLRG